MSSHPKMDILKLNKNTFPICILECLKIDKRNEPPAIVKLILKTWYQSSFQKGNRWNKSLIAKGVKNYLIDELDYLKSCFGILFNCSKKYNKVFISYLDEIVEKNTADESGFTTPKIKISQKSFTELLRTIGEIKKAGEIKNNSAELAEIINRSFASDIQLRPSTIVDRLKNKKGYS